MLGRDPVPVLSRLTGGCEPWCGACERCRAARRMNVTASRLWAAECHIHPLAWRETAGPA
jgi:hypothetical protein